jgi:PAS domain S-box-containing protein
MATEQPGPASSPLKICLIYIITAGLWILASDHVITVFFSDLQTVRWAATLKGWLFVIVTASVLFWLMHRQSRAISYSRSSLRKVHRALEALRDCNQALVRSDDESGLMNEICRIIVEIGGYRAAWVGLAEQNEQKTIRVTAQWGHEKDYLEKLNFTWADSERGRTSTGRAIRTGVPTVVQNIITNPETTAWRDEALRNNTASAASFPLSNHNGPFGALVIYAKEPDAFDTEELNLLKELADDLSYGMGTLRLRARREQEEKERRLLATACEQLEEGVAILDNRGAVQYLNLSLERISGYDRTAITGRDIRELGNDRETGKIFGAMADAMAHNAFWSGRFTAGNGRNGSPFEIEMSVSPLRDNGGKVTNYVFVSRDVSQEERLEKQLRQAQKMEALGTLAGGIAHDFNNILGAIISCTEFALEDAPETSPTREDLEHVLKASFRGKNLIKQILTFSRLSDQERHPVQVAPLVKECLKFLRSALPASIEIRQNISSRTGMIFADATQIHQVIVNLCSNASHAMRETGGILDVSLSEVIADPSTTVCPQDVAAGPCVKLAIGDTGHGMDQKTIERIFDPFFTTKKRGEGTGLGLSVVHGIISSHGGAITVSSEPGKGTTFEVFLPAIEQLGDFLESSDGSAVPRGTERVLFVDDEEDLLYAGEKMLKRLGYEPVVFGNSVEALKAFRTKPDGFDLIVTDQSMPQMTGTELAREALRIRPGTPIILCSGFSADSGETITRQEAEAIGIREVLMKPLGNAEMAGIIRKILDEKIS